MTLVSVMGPVVPGRDASVAKIEALVDASDCSGAMVGSDPIQP